MNRDKLRDEIVQWLYNETTLSEVECEAAGDGLLSLPALREALEKAEKTKKALVAVLDLINNSYGVAGLHFNGNVAPWDSLLEGGEFEEWLKDFSKAIEVKNGQ